jgi:endonuclease/exonuclease/phosphatase (EEP) superfamily protein YafD
MELLRAAALLAAAACCLAALLSVCGRFSDTLDIFSHFMPVYLVGAAAALIFALVEGAGSNAPTTVLALAAMALSLSLMAPDLIARAIPDRAAAGGRTLKVIQFNLWARNVDPQGTAGWILAQDADILVLQEASGRGAAVVNALREAYPHATPREASSDGGTVILAKAPLRASGGLRAPRSENPPSVAWATFGEGGEAFTVVGAHYTWPIPAGPQQAQSRRLAALLERFDRERLIVTGDFNSAAWSWGLRRQDRQFGLRRLTRALFTWPTDHFARWRMTSPLPFLAIDHVYAGQAWTAISVRRGPKLGSDHFPIVVTLARTPRAGLRRRVS